MEVTISSLPGPKVSSESTSQYPIDDILDKILYLSPCGTALSHQALIHIHLHIPKEEVSSSSSPVHVRTRRIPNRQLPTPDHALILIQDGNPFASAEIHLKAKLHHTRHRRTKDRPPIPSHQLVSIETLAPDPLVRRAPPLGYVYSRQPIPNNMVHAQTHRPPPMPTAPLEIRLRDRRVAFRFHYLCDDFRPYDSSAKPDKSPPTKIEKDVPRFFLCYCLWGIGLESGLLGFVSDIEQLQSFKVRVRVAEAGEDEGDGGFVDT
ncbi:MAG: hypothetical protein LQ338_002930 [Usnochroma carphineum]|nr:MAG: hypothetical protein LQ338_002930 [Usnochroma carphineum]